MNNTLPPEIESLCIQNIGSRKVPLWPYVVAVTGHRFFAKPGEVEGLPGYNPETIKNTFRKELEQMALQWKKACGKVNAPFLLLTGMADGSDQLAAEVALELPAELNVKVAAVLPMDKELFRLTLNDKERFDSLLKRVYLTYSLPLPDNSPQYRAKIADVTNHDTDCLREKQYNNLGKFLALHSHVLFAFWDGIDMPNLVGGTSTVLHFKLEGNTEKQTRSDILTYTSVGPVVHFLLPRNNQSNLNEPMAELENPEEIAVFYWSKHDLWDKDNKRYFFPSRKQMTEENRCKTSVSLKQEIVDTLNRIGDLNRQSMKRSRKLQKTLNKSCDYLFECQSDAMDFCDAETKALILHYTYADQLAERFKNWMQTFACFYLFGVALFLLSGSFFSTLWEIRQNDWGKNTWFSFVHNGENTFYDIFCSGNSWSFFNWLTIVYWCSIAMFIIVYLWSASRKYRLRFYRFRAVAEALRVQIFWRIAGMNDCVSGHYRTHQLSETEWLRAAINGLDVLLDAPKDMNFMKTKTERLKFVRDVWINGQLKFFHKRLDTGKSSLPVSRLEYGLLAIWLVSIIVFPFFSTWMELYHVRYASIVEWGQIFYGLLLVLFPVYEVWLYWKTIKQPQSDLDRYKQMLFPFDRAILLLRLEMEKEYPQESEDKIEELYHILRQLGTEAVSENAAWYLSFGERKLTMPQ